MYPLTDMGFISLGHFFLQYTSIYTSNKRQRIQLVFSFKVLMHQSFHLHYRASTVRLNRQCSSSSLCVSDCASPFSPVSLFTPLVLCLSARLYVWVQRSMSLLLLISQLTCYPSTHQAAAVFSSALCSSPLFTFEVWLRTLQQTVTVFPFVCLNII